MDPVFWIAIVAVVAIVSQVSTTFLIFFKNNNKGSSVLSKNKKGTIDYVDIEKIKAKLNLQEVSGDIQTNETTIKVDNDSLNKLRELKKGKNL
jgi:flagellar biosynthesis/type III secretory pathway M-ring protein FliF/YscJ